MTPVTIGHWPEELTYLLDGMFTPAQMPSVYFEYGLCKTAMHYGGWTYLMTDPKVFFHIKEIYIDKDGNYGIIPYNRSD